MTKLGEKKFAFEAIPGIFAQSLPETDALAFDYLKDNMGLIVHDDTPLEKPWTRLTQYIEHLQATAPPGTFYKLIINGRHGQGFHNVAQAKHGTKVWDEEISKQDELFDAHLTEIGVQQALSANRFLREQFTKGLPAPESYIVSPLHRCLQTAYLTYGDLDLPEDRPFKPLIKELLRECLGVHTCDRRSTRSVIHAAWPEADIEPGFVEEDLLWKPDHREIHEEHDIRMQAFLDDVFDNDKSTVISLTSHSGSISCMLRVLGHRPFKPLTGAIMPLLVKATRLDA
ncbi:hypothetical protein AMS68_006394 [Peltaster fructicola]|uniref:Phosphoglycerate mutase n=1 Tax=Peltaster fructicola TaxID=286661 RepID=A0A6H0Y1L6_9PEZI|nr:hypothetical protein AMS68_006394 [Peltaster fructicola]